MSKQIPANLKIEIIIGCIIFIAAYLIFGQYDVLEKITAWSSAHEEYEVDELISASLVLLVLSLVFSFRRYRESVQKNKKLQKALDDIKVLKGIIPICSYCKSIRDDAGSWNQLETYVRSHSSAEFSHGVCPDCFDKITKNMDTEDQQQHNTE